MAKCMIVQVTALRTESIYLMRHIYTFGNVKTRIPKSFFVSEKQEFRNKKANQSALNEVYKMKMGNNNTKMSKMVKVKHSLC